MSYIFISYSHTDSGYAHKLAAALEHNGFLPWVDDRIDYGSQWPRVIQEQLDGCAAFIVIMTPRAYASDWVQNELNRAKRKRKPIIPLLLEGDEPWLSVEAIQYLDVRGGMLPPPRFYERLAQLVPRREIAKELRTFNMPMLEWCEVPAGQMSGFPIQAFRISKYPVTNQQFAMFAESPDGYANARWWDYSPQARAWRAATQSAAAPCYPGATLPRETVSWFEAIAFCRWLSFETGLAITLPTEHQWQRAAQGNERHEYPWGAVYDPAHCNSNNRFRRTTPVDAFPGGGSPFGALDMAGNVWEWCRTGFESADNDIQGDALRVVRGGA